MVCHVVDDVSRSVSVYICGVEILQEHDRVSFLEYKSMIGQNKARSESVEHLEGISRVVFVFVPCFVHTAVFSSVSWHHCHDNGVDSSEVRFFRCKCSVYHDLVFFTVLFGDEVEQEIEDGSYIFYDVN